MGYLDDVSRISSLATVDGAQQLVVRWLDDTNGFLHQPCLAKVLSGRIAYSVPPPEPTLSGPKPPEDGNDSDWNACDEDFQSEADEDRWKRNGKSEKLRFMNMQCKACGIPALMPAGFAGLPDGDNSIWIRTQLKCAWKTCPVGRAWNLSAL